MRRRWYYIIFFIVFFTFWFLFKIGGWADFGKAFLSTFVDVFVTSITMLIIVELLLPKQLYRNRYTIFFTCSILLILFSGSVIIFSQLNLLGSSLANYQKNVEKHNAHYFYWFWADLIFGSYFLVAFISATGAAIRFAFDRIKTVNQFEKLEKEKVNAELQSLKNQINPHFLFNALNTIYYKIDRSNINARDTLQRFSEMLRYQLYDCDKEMIGIDKELLFLQSYIELQKERLNGNYEVVYRGFDSVKEFQISPFLLLPLVENCFKYVSSYADQLNKILIEVKQEENSFSLYTLNTVEIQNNQEKKGIGLKNIKKRLHLLYPGSHLIDTNGTEGFFEVNLKLDLK